MKVGVPSTLFEHTPSWGKAAIQTGCVAVAAAVGLYALSSFQTSCAGAVAVATMASRIGAPPVSALAVSALSFCLPEVLAAPGALFNADVLTLSLNVAPADPFLGSRLSVNGTDAAAIWDFDSGVDEQEVGGNDLNLTSNSASGARVINPVSAGDQNGADVALVRGERWDVFIDDQGASSDLVLMTGGGPANVISPNASFPFYRGPRLLASQVSDVVGLLVQAVENVGAKAGIYFGLLDAADGSWIGGVQRINNDTTENALFPALEETSSGEWNIAWLRQNDGIYFRPVGGLEVRIVDDPNASRITLKTLASGNSLVSYQTENGSFEPRAMLMEIDSAGAVVSAPTGLTPGYTSEHPSIGVDANGQQVITYADRTTGDIMITLRSPDGTVQIPAEPIPGPSVVSGKTPVIGMDRSSEGHLVLSWKEGTDLKAQQVRYAYLREVPGSADPIDYNEEALTQVPNQSFIASASEISVTYRIPIESGRLSTLAGGATDPAYNASTGELTLSGPVATVNAQLANLTFTSNLGYFENFDLEREVGEPTDLVFIEDVIPLMGTHVNHAPFLSSVPAPVSGIVGSPIVVPLDVQDVDQGDVVSVTRPSEPNWLQPLGASLQGTPNAPFNGSVFFNLTDGEATSGPHSFPLSVVSAPTSAIPSVAPSLRPVSTTTEAPTGLQKANRWWLNYMVLPMGILGALALIWNTCFPKSWRMKVRAPFKACGRKIKQKCCKSSQVKEEGGAEMGSVSP